MSDGFSIAAILLALLRVYEMMLLIRIMISWLPSLDHDHPVLQWLHRLTEPVLIPARELYMRLLDRLGVQMPIDLSPILIFILIGFLERTLASMAF